MTLPPALKGLVDKLPKTGIEKLDGLLGGEIPRGLNDGSPPTTNQLLDYLLAP